ncbi:MAG TPA: class I lanthipeptide [Flavobacterium sp.]|nr:class I lanthipeptide [Flavobacterium sp.]
MKKQNVNNQLSFDKAAIVELNDSNMLTIQGGSLDTITQAVQQVLDNVHDAAYNVSYVVSKAIATR